MQDGELSLRQTHGFHSVKGDMVVRLDNDKRKNIEDIKNILVPTPQGIQIPLSQIARIELKNSPNQIQREDTKRRIVVGFNPQYALGIIKLRGKVFNFVKY